MAETTKPANGRTPGVIVTDCDLKAMQAISKAMAGLTETKDRESVIEWFWKKYDGREATKP